LTMSSDCADPGRFSRSAPYAELPRWLLQGYISFCETVEQASK
jgi:hypothetical protein